MNTRIKRRKPDVVAVEATPSHLLAEPVVDDVPVPVVEDAAAEADAARAAAADARARAADAVAAAQLEADRLLDEARRRSTALELEARRHDEDAEAAQAVADRAAALVATEAEVIALQDARDRLAGEAQGLEAEVDRLGVRLAELAAAQNEASQRRAMAVRGDDAPGLRAAVTELMTAAELAQARSADLSTAQDRLAAVRTEHGEVCKALGRAGVRLLALRRDEAGLPPVEELVELTLAALPMLVTSMMASDPERLAELMLAAVPASGREQMAEAIRLGSHDPHGMVGLASTAAGAVLGPQILASLQQLALDDPEQYEGVKSLVLAPADPRVVRRPADDAAGMVAAVLGGGGR